jgi:hypothetical protein
MRSFLLGAALALTVSTVTAQYWWPYPHGIQTVAVRLRPVALAPFPCTAATTGVTFYNRTSGQICTCNGTNYTRWVDGSTHCTTTTTTTTTTTSTTTTTTTTSTTTTT